MLNRPLLTVVMGLALLSRTVHCLYTTADLCALAAADRSPAGRPLTNPTAADPNESGCICKGALVAHADLLSPVSLALKAPSPFEVMRVADCRADEAAARAAAVIDLAAASCPPIYGRALRAWVASLLI